MFSKEIRMSEGSLPKNIILFSLPLMFSNVLQVLFNMADIAVVGRAAGTAALGAVGSTPMLIFLFTGFLQGLGSGVNVLSAFHLGANDKRELDETVHTSALFCLFSGILLMLLGFAVSRPVLSLMKTKPELLDGAVLYFNIYILGLPALSLFNFGNAVLSATGDTKRPVIYLSVAGILNVGLNLLFVISFHMDVAGVALASVIAQYLSAVLILIRLFKGTDKVQLCIKKLHVNRGKLIQLMKIGVPSGLQNAIFAIANVFIQAGVNTFDQSMVSGNAAAANADPFIYDILAAFYTACATFIGQNYGAGKKKRILDSYLIVTVYSFATALVLGLLLFIFGRQFVSIFTTDPAVIDAGMQRLKIMSLSYCISIFMDATIAASRGLGKTLVPSIIVILGSCLFRIAWIYTVFAWLQTIESLFLLYIFSWLITSVAEIIYFIRVYRRTEV